jgi:hypothetical protein
MITKLNVNILDECIFYQNLFKGWETLSYEDDRHIFKFN